MPECFAPTRPRFSENLALVLRNRPLKPLPRLYFTFIQPTLINYLLAKKIRSRISTPDNLLTLDLPIYWKTLATLALTSG